MTSAYKRECARRKNNDHTLHGSSAGICDDPDDAAELKEEFDKKFGVTECDPNHMLGVRRVWHTERDADTGKTRLVQRHDQEAYIDNTWEKYGEYRTPQKRLIPNLNQEQHTTAATAY